MGWVIVNDKFKAIFALMFDIAIVGAGPAGATLARLIGNRYRVLLVDKRPLIEGSQTFSAAKCCGGLLAPDAQRMLSELGLGVPGYVLEGPQLFAVRAIDIQQALERYYQRHYLNVDRKKFDSWLLSLVPPRVEIRGNCHFTSYSRENSSFRIHLRQGDRPYTENVKILVGADGATSILRPQLASGESFPRKYIAIQEWTEGNGNLPYFTSMFDRRISDYYCWTIPKSDYLIIGAALDPGAEASGKFNLLKTVLKDRGIYSGKTVKREGAFIFRPRRMKNLYTGINGTALIGEAAGWISPSSAEGISYAFKSARVLAEALLIAPEEFEKRYYENTRSLRINIVLKILKSLVIFNPSLRKALMKSGLQCVEPYRSHESA